MKGHGCQRGREQRAAHCGPPQPDHIDGSLLVASSLRGSFSWSQKDCWVSVLLCPLQGWQSFAFPTLLPHVADDPTHPSLHLPHQQHPLSQAPSTSNTRILLLEYSNITRGGWTGGNPKRAAGICCWPKHTRQPGTTRREGRGKERLLHEW